jgi:hypothetical protein
MGLRVTSARRAVLWLLACGVAVTCRDSTGVGNLPSTVIVTGRDTLRVGERVRFLARVVRVRGDTVADMAVRWSSGDTAVAMVEGDGTVVTRAPGAALITATTGTVSGSMTVAVTVWPVAAVRVVLPVDSFVIGDSALAQIITVDSTDRPLTGRAVVVRSSDSSRVTIAADGWIRTRGLGGVAITAESEGRVGGAFVTVRDHVGAIMLPDSIRLNGPGDTAFLVARVIGARGGLVTAPLEWSTVDSGVAVATAPGLIVAVAEGVTRLIASCCDSLADTTIVTVPPFPTTGRRGTVSFNGDIRDILPGTSIEVSASIIAYDGLPASPWPSWRIGDTTVATIVPAPAPSEEATITGRRPGTTLVFAESDGIRDSFRLVVRPVPWLEVVPDTIGVRVGVWSPVYGSIRDTSGWRMETFYTTYSWPVFFVDVLDPAVAGWINPFPYVVGWRSGTTRAVAHIDFLGITLTDTIVLNVVANTARLFFDADTPNVELAVPRFDSARTVLRLRDALGRPLATSGTVRLTMGDTALATVAPASVAGLSDSAAFTIRARRDGYTTLVAEADSLRAVLRVRVLGRSQMSIDAALPARVRTGDSVAVPVVVRDERGVPYPYEVGWVSSDSAVAIVTSDGWLMARGSGQALITARSGWIQDTATVLVDDPAAPALSGLAPAVWWTDSVVTLTGTGFAPLPGDNQVSVDGVSAPVVSVDSARLQIRVPSDSLFACVPERTVRVAVTTTRGTASGWARLAVGVRRTPAVGESLVLTGRSAQRCTALPLDGNVYEVAVAGPALAPHDSTRFILRGGASATMGAPPVSAGPVGGSRDPTLTLPDVGALRSRQAARHRVLEESRRLAARLGPPAPLLRARRGPQASVGDSIGGLVRFRVPDIGYPDFCARYTAVTARRAYQGEHLDIFVDTLSVAASFTDSTFTRTGREFDTVMWPLIESHFGDPLVLDSLLDRNRKLVALVTPRVNPYAAGFVVSCDFYPESYAPSSNTGEIVYLASPDGGAPDFPGGLGAYWEWLMRSVLVHEAKHAAAFAQRLAANFPFEESWLEEGSAVIAEELWARAVYRAPWKGDIAYRASLYCDVRPAWPECAGRPFALFGTFALLHDFGFDGWSGVPAYERHSPLGPTAADDATFYATAWSLLRWTLDRAPGAEADVLRALTRSPTVGVANLESVAGRDYPALVGDWLLSAALDNTSYPTAFAFPSWNLRDIFFGMRTDFPDLFPGEPFGQRLLQHGGFVWPVTLRGGSATLFRLSDAQQRPNLLIQLAAPPDRPLPPDMRMTIVRLR